MLELAAQHACQTPGPAGRVLQTCIDSEPAHGVSCKTCLDNSARRAISALDILHTTGPPQVGRFITTFKRQNGPAAGPTHAGARLQRAEAPAAPRGRVAGVSLDVSTCPVRRALLAVVGGLVALSGSLSSGRLEGLLHGPPEQPARGDALPEREDLREGRGVSDQYGVKDAACPLSTGALPEREDLPPPRAWACGGHCAGGGRWRCAGGATVNFAFSKHGETCYCLIRGCGRG